MGGIAVGGGGDGTVGQSVVAHTHIRLAHAGVGGVDGLGVGGDLAQVAGGPQDVGVLGGDGWARQSVTVGGGGVADGSGRRITGVSAEVAGVGHGHEGGEDEELKQ